MVFFWGANIVLAGTWSRTFDTGGIAKVVQRTRDGGSIVVGKSGVTQLLKLNAMGEIEWGKQYYCGSVNALRETDHGYIAVGQSAYSPNHEIFVLHLDSQGGVRWVNYFREAGSVTTSKIAADVIQTRDFNFVIAGYANNFETDPVRNEDAWVLKLNWGGGVVWSRTFGTTSNERAKSIRQTTDGGFIVAGDRMGDAWVAKLNGSGTALWQKLYSPENMSGDTATVQQTADGGFAVTGTVQPLPDGETAAWLLKIDSTGDFPWQKVYAAENFNIVANDLIETLDRGFLIAGSQSYAISDRPDLWIIRLDQSGTILWQKQHLSIDDSSAYSADITPENGFIVAGGRWEDPGTNYDYWVLKTNAEGEVDQSSCQTLPTIALETAPNVSVYTIDDAGVALNLKTWDYGPLSWIDRNWSSTFLCGAPADHYEDDDECMTTGNFIFAADTQHHSFADDETDWVGFNACAGRSYIILTSSLVNADTTLELYGPDCTTLLASDEDSGSGLASRIEWTASQNGTYHIRVNAKPGDDGYYDLTLEGDTSGCGHWMREYRGSRDSTTHSIFQTADGGFVLAGSMNRIAWGNEMAIIKMDADGNVSWHKTYGHTTDSVTASAIKQTPDGGYIVVGNYHFYSGERSILVMKTDADGVPEWTKRYLGAIFQGTANSVVLTNDGGIVFAGYILIMISPPYSEQGYVVKIDGSGDIIWQKFYGGNNFDTFETVKSLPGGGLLVAGETTSYGAGSSDVWVLRLDANGNIQWQRVMGTSISEFLESMDVTPDGGCILGGINSQNDSWLVKLDLAGNVSWDRTLRSQPEPPNLTSNLTINTLSAMSDGSFMAAGYKEDTDWFDFYMDAFLIRYDHLGAAQWYKTYGNGGYSFENVTASTPTASGEIAFSGFAGNGGVTMFLKPDELGEIGLCNLINVPQLSGWYLFPEITETTAIGTQLSSVPVSDITLTVTDQTTNTEETCPQPEPCLCDFAPADGDVDGANLADYISDSAGISLNDFAAEFGRVDCF